MANTAITDTKLRTNYQSRTEWLALSAIHVEPKAQRQFDERWARILATTLDPDLLGLPAVVALPNANGRGERYVCVDGQHRIAAVKMALGEHQMIECEVIRGIDLARAAAIYRGRNHIRLARPFDLFVAGRTAQDPECLAIDKIVRAAGFVINMGSQDGYIPSVSALTKIYRMSAAPGELLTKVLLALKNIWGVTRDATEGDLLMGMALFLRRYGDEIDLSSLSRKLRGFPGGARGLCGRARSLKEGLRGSVATNLARALVATYNTARRKENKIAEWGQ